MTLVAAFEFEGVPLLIGDIAISSKKGSAPRGRLPTLGDQLPPSAPGATHVISNLRQKLCVLGDNLIVGWSGKYSQAHQLLNRLLEDNQRGPFSFQELEKYLYDASTMREYEGVKLTGFHYQEGPTPRPFGFHCPAEDIGGFGSVRAIGSGGADIVKMLRYYDDHPLEISADAPLNRCITFIQMLIGNLLQSEVDGRLHSFHRLYGGGYEIASFINGRLCKFEDLVQLFWDAWASEDGELNFPRFPLVFRYGYTGDILIIRRAEFEVSPEDTATGRTVVDSGFAVHPAHRVIDVDEVSQLPLPSLAARGTWNFIRFPLPSGHLKVIGILDYSEDQSVGIRFIDDESGLRLVAKPATLMRIGRIVRRILGV